MESLEVMESCFVAPKEATPTKGLWLSPIDLAATRGHTTLVHFYRSGAASFRDVARLKEAMAKALVPFYLVAGRLGVDDDGRLEISCNGEGVLFVVASSSLVAQDFDFSKPSPELRRTFVPRIEPPSLIMAIQLAGDILEVWRSGVRNGQQPSRASGILARRLPPNTIARLSFPVDVRRRGALEPPLPTRYFGNALVSLCVAGAARDIASEALASVAARIGRAIAGMGDELVRSAVDYLELADKADSRPHRGSLPETELRIVSWLGFPEHDADFGCGAPEVMSRAESVRGGFVHIISDGPVNHRGGSAVRVVVCMEAANIKGFERLLYANIANHASKL